MTLKMPWAKAATEDSLLDQIRHVSLPHVVRDEVLALILRGELAPGDRITEPMVAARLGVSRVPVREALRDLESTGLVESRKHAGVFVRQLSARETADLYELRSVLDAFAGRVAATMPDAALIAKLDRHLASMNAAAETKDVMAYYEANLHFHWDIIHASGNRQICDVYQGAVQKLHLARLKNLSTDVGMLNSLREHHAIVDAIRQGQPERCEALMASHVKTAGERLRKLIFEGDNNEAETHP
ncbi:transcriptional regulator, GntR family [Noviherbaspirillum humi]|uniref:Transcriptional regulator, GntR family n=1 Tax=Noviherbaspirillum humi TaxID=1688639 RepID=A0A239LRC4_9BURK|nr:GntR family transcriptional regulator [Noviherbaspirillum humi]SNT32343.1 transcriptional regulator, GntR family [Noviherbaspirillum humi]